MEERRMASFIPPGLGWQRDLMDPRDYFPDHARVRPLLMTLKADRTARSGSHRVIDWREFFPRVDCQLDLPSSCAHACVALVAYFERRSSGRFLEGSRLFLHQMARSLLCQTVNCGICLRQTCKALVRFGLPPEGYWPYQPDRLDETPGSFLFSFASEYAPLLYVRPGRSLTTGRRTLASLRSFLAAGFPVAFGFTVFDSLSREALIPFPTCYDSVRGGQAAVALGYDDRLRIRSEKGALLVRLSWGADWGEDGYGWLPYRYVEQELAADFWTLLRPDWLNSEEFHQPS
jgi:C1A family cysteine protease